MKPLEDFHGAFPELTDIIWVLGRMDSRVAIITQETSSVGKLQEEVEVPILDEGSVIAYNVLVSGLLVEGCKCFGLVEKESSIALAMVGFEHVNTVRGGSSPLSSVPLILRHLWNVGDWKPCGS